MSFTREKFDQIIDRLKQLYPAQASQIPGYFSFNSPRGVVVVKRNAPSPIRQAYALLRTQSGNNRPLTGKDLPETVAKHLLSEFLDYREYREIRRTAVQWTVIVYAYLLSLRRREAVRFRLTFDRFRLECVKKGFTETPDHHSSITAVIHAPDGERLFQKEYVIPGDMTYDDDDYHFLADLYHLLSLYPIQIDPFQHDELQDLLVNIRRDSHALLLITRYGLSLRRLATTRASPELMAVRFPKSEREWISGWGKRVHVNLLTRDRLPKIGQQVDFRRNGAWLTGRVSKKNHPYEYDVMGEEGVVFHSIDYSDIRFRTLSPVPKNRRMMNILEYLYKFPILPSREQASRIADDMD